MNFDNYYKNYGSDPSKYVSICPSDFDTHCTMANAAKRIASDKCFDRKCTQLCNERKHRFYGGMVWNG